MSNALWTLLKQDLGRPCLETELYVVHVPCLSTYKLILTSLIILYSLGLAGVYIDVRIAYDSVENGLRRRTPSSI